MFLLTPFKEHQKNCTFRCSLDLSRIEPSNVWCTTDDCLRWRRVFTVTMTVVYSSIPCLSIHSTSLLFSSQDGLQFQINSFFTPFWFVGDSLFLVVQEIQLQWHIEGISDWFSGLNNLNCCRSLPMFQYLN